VKVAMLDALFDALISDIELTLNHLIEKRKQRSD
jgi:RNAse (barnase) inhibitor barstar